MSSSILSIGGLDAYYGESQALFDVSLTLDDREVVGIFGRNGMGKTTLLRSIVNQVEHTGSIVYRDEEISDRPTYDIVRRGIAYVPEDRSIYGELTVDENLSVATPTGVDGDEQQRRREWIFDLFPRLEERLAQQAGTLSGGEQQMLAIARGLIVDPDILLLDEPTEGLAPVIIDDLVETIGELAASDRTILLVEQNIARTLSVVDRGYFIENGTVVADGSSEELADEELQRRYLTV